MIGPVTVGGVTVEASVDASDGPRAGGGGVARAAARAREGCEGGEREKERRFAESAGAGHREILLRNAHMVSVFFMKLLLLPTNAIPMAPPPVPQSELPNQQ